MSKGYELRGMPLKSTVTTWKKFKTVTRDSKNITDFYLKNLEWLATNKENKLNSNDLD